MDTTATSSLKERWPRDLAAVDHFRPRRSRLVHRLVASSYALLFFMSRNLAAVADGRGVAILIDAPHVFGTFLADLL